MLGSTRSRPLAFYGQKENRYTRKPTHTHTHTHRGERQYVCCSCSWPPFRLQFVTCKGWGHLPYAPAAPLCFHFNHKSITQKPLFSARGKIYTYIHTIYAMPSILLMWVTAEENCGWAGERRRLTENMVEKYYTSVITCIETLKWHSLWKCI